MRRSGFAVLISSVLFVSLPNGHASSESFVFCCEFMTKSFTNSSETTDTYGPNATTTTTTTTTTAPKTKTQYNTSTAGEPPAYAKTREGLLSLFGSKAALDKLSAPEIKSATLRLFSYYRSPASRLPDAVVVNLVATYATTERLFSSLSQPAVNSLLLLSTVDRPSALHGNAVRAQFLNALLSLSPGVLHRVPGSVFVSAIGTVASRDVFDGLSRTAATNLITVLSLSRPLFNCLPLPTLVSFITYASAAPAVAWPGFPPSTLFRFFGALLDTLTDRTPFAADRVPHPVLVALIDATRLMSSRMLSVLPADSLDALLDLLGSSPSLATTLPAVHFQSLFSVLKTSPAVLSSLTPSRLAGVLATVRSCPSVLNQLPPNLINELLDSIAVYSPSTLRCIPTNAV